MPNEGNRMYIYWRHYSMYYHIALNQTYWAKYLLFVDEITTRYSSAAEQNRQLYKLKCQNLGIVPSRKILNQFNGPVFSASGLNLSPRELRAIYVVLIVSKGIKRSRLTKTSYKPISVWRIWLSLTLWKITFLHM